MAGLSSQVQHAIKENLWTHLNANKRQALFSGVRIVLQYNERHHKESRLVRFPCDVFSYFFRSFSGRESFLYRRGDKPMTRLNCLEK